MALTRSVLRQRLADWLDRLQVDIGLLDVRFRGKTLRVEIGSCSFQWKRGGPRGQPTIGSRAEIRRRLVSLCCASLGVPCRRPET